MRLKFQIKEKLHEIEDEILRSHKWSAVVKEDEKGIKRITIKDPYYDSNALIDIWGQEIHITTAWSQYTYRIYEKENVVWCEYVGAYKGLLEQHLLPTITPVEDFLDSKVLESTLTDDKEETLLKYSLEKRCQNEQNGAQKKDGASVKHSESHHPKVVYDEFIKIGVPMPPVK